MRILIAHSRYQQPGGEETVVEQEHQLLEEAGHTVFRFERNNDDVQGMSKIQLATNTIHSRSSANEIYDFVKRERIAIMHVHNTLPLLSPSIYRAAKRAGAGVVQTLHNFRLMCANGFLLRDGKICEKCVGRRLALPGVKYGCYRGSKTESAGVVSSVAFNRFIGNYSFVDRYIALTNFAKQKFIEHGLPASKLTVKPNFLASDPGFSEHSRSGLLFVGRLAPEKGIEDLLHAWEKSSATGVLTVVGDGPLFESLQTRLRADSSVRLLGRQSHEQVLDHMRSTRAVIVPSRWYENLPMTIVEAMAVGTPVVVPDHGPLPDIVGELGGWTYRPGDTDALAHTLQHSCELQKDSDLYRTVRRRFEAKYTPQINIKLMENLYNEILQSH